MICWQIARVADNQKFTVGILLFVFYCFVVCCPIVVVFIVLLLWCLLLLLWCLLFYCCGVCCLWRANSAVSDVLSRARINRLSSDRFAERGHPFSTYTANIIHNSYHMPQVDKNSQRVSIVRNHREIIKQAAEFLPCRGTFFSEISSNFQLLVNKFFLKQTNFFRNGSILIETVSFHGDIDHQYRCFPLWIFPDSNTSKKRTKM